MAVQTNSNDLKRLGFIRSYSSYAFDKTYSLASNVYSTGKHYAPASLEPHIKAAEEKVTELGSPLVSKLQDRSDFVLHTLDSKVSAGGLSTCLSRPGRLVGVAPRAPGSRSAPGMGAERSCIAPCQQHTTGARRGRAGAVQVDSLLVGAHHRYNNSAEQLQTSVNNQKKFHEKNLEHYNSSREAYLKRIEETVEFIKKEGISGAAKLAADTVAARVEDAKQLPAYFDKEAKVGGCAPFCRIYFSQ